MKALAWGLISGLLVSVLVVWQPFLWEYAPGAVFGIVIAAYFAKDAWNARKNKLWVIAGLAAFIILSYFAYALALHEAEWVLGTNGFASFDSYRESSALAALFVGAFVGGCIGAFFLAIGIWLFIFKFDLVRGLFVFSLFAGALGSIIAAGFEAFGFLPEFLFPAWHLGVLEVVLYLRHERELQMMPPPKEVQPA